ncbi:MAG: substrate-binding domain-containing protein [Bacillota bacterium]|nr:substrate-binding domain-containing protein [Bacillota bacterium]
MQMPAEGNDFFIEVARGIDQASDELADYGLSVSVQTMKGYCAETQIRQVRDLIAEGVHGLAIVPIDCPSIRKLFDDLAGRNLPVIAFNTDITDGRRLCYIGNDYLHSGRIAAGVLGLASGGAALDTLIVTGSTQVLGHNQRIAGFHTTIRSHYPWIKIIDIEENQDDDETSYRHIESILTTGKQFQALYLTAGGVAGACRALEAHNLGGAVKVICFDQVSSATRYHQSGLITASIGQDPYQQGYQAVKRLFDYLLDGTLPPDKIITRNEIMIREHFPEQCP